MLNFKRSLGSVGTIGLLGHRLGVHDAMLGLMGTVSQILTSAVYLLSPLTVYLMYIAPFLDIFNGVNSIVNRSLLAKTVSKDELGEIKIRRGKGGLPIFRTSKTDAFSTNTQSIVWVKCFNRCPGAGPNTTHLTVSLILSLLRSSRSKRTRRVDGS